MRTKRVLRIIAVSLFLVGLLGACSGQKSSDVTSVSDAQDDAGSETGLEETGQVIDAGRNTGSGGERPVPAELKTIPEEYYQAADQQGTLVELTYNTYESKTYEQKSKKLTKRAIVYLPYGYSEDKKYNVFYLMHGGWGNETTTLGTLENPNSFKNVIDHAIENGEAEPLIIVCPTYNNESPRDSADYTLAFYTLTVNYHNELVNDLIPAVEGAYSTYAASTSPEDIQNSRDHRAFGGFSMGSVTTWYTFVNCLDEFRYFLPMSGAMDYEGDDVDAAVTASGHSPVDFFIYAITGTDDFECGHFTRQLEGMLGMSSGNFISTDSEESGNVAFRIKDGYSHDGRAAMEYTYNGLLWFWN
ncbi:alpha/beta hydrolase [Anaerobium acetethylicum]|uniref:Putative esterase n=1 Tax=Anaerobium acetethylicum TaxID=1619234 RepID=A0A1D3TPL7_9FIRM|nr:alpha/beta hydrolase-fold protein [Anaerobium acetethylicum]SCP95402.1 Putative esterase [Anaerobium acetethylicum]